MLKRFVRWHDCRRVALLTLCLVVTQAIPHRVWAEPWSLPSQDGFVDPNNAATVYDDNRLELTFSNFPAFVPTRRTLLQFDLTAQEHVLTGTQLQLTILENNINVNSTVVVALYATADGWSENNVTWETRPVEATRLQTVTVTGGALGAVVFDANTVGDYFESERIGDQHASLYLLLSGGEGTLGFGGNLFFDDSEGSADGINGNEPTLLLPTAPSMERLYLPLIHK